jgi:hypothetical protein
MRKIGMALGLAGLFAAAPLGANDSAASIGLGGLVLTRNEAISMDSEDLFISQAEVRVRYRFTNRSSRPVETLVSFPVPVLPDDIPGYLGDQEYPDFSAMKFRTTVDGRPVKLDFVQRAMIGPRDVTARIAALGWPLRWFSSFEETVPFIERLGAAQQETYRREGLLKADPNLARKLIPAWSLVTHVTRRQIFPAGRSVEVTHAYTPIAGGSVGGGLERHFRRDEIFAEKQRKYCIDSDFTAAFDRRTAPRGGKQAYGSEVWLDYMLSSGANWRGPIRDFRLVVDKGKPDNLVSFCMDGVRKISPTQFEVRKTNFEPRRDLPVLIVEFYTPE